MSLSFACPECKAPIEVADEHAGQTGQCPRCQNLIEIPALNQRQVPMPRVEARAKPRRVDEDEPPIRPRRSRAEPKPTPPAGPVWPWLIGIAAALVMAGLLFSSFIVLVSWRRSEPIRVHFKDEIRAIGLMDNPVPNVGRFEGNTAILENGVFQLRSALNQNDPPDREFPRSRGKNFAVELQAGKAYLLELDSNQFDSQIRLGNLQNVVLARAQSNRFNRVAVIQFAPPRTEFYDIFITSVEPSFGDFTLTIRENHRPKPFVAP